ncbi:sensor histidine kinase [Haliangium ochraceum]|uniref:sensor histidine kinase n=1 Tax=Haliangium ochraceum TaxID=80816 RepID=UPI00019B9570|nr:HAMP domain-containing sensor histidine kinase [Haliangium ochraceum]
MVFFLGWWADITVVRTLGPGLASMKVNTALCFIASGVALWRLLRREELARASRLTDALALLVIGISGSSLLADTFHWSLWIDEFLFTDPNPRGMPWPGRMSPATAFGLTLVGMCLLSYDRKGIERVWLPHLLGALVSLNGLIAVVGYAYGVSALYQVRPYVSMALHTATAFLLLGIGLVSVPPWRGIPGLLLTAGSDGRMLRRLLPIALLVPLVLGWMAMQGSHNGWYGSRFGFVLAALASSLLLVSVVGRTGLVLGRAERARRRALQQLSEQEEWLSTTLSSIADGVIATDQGARISFANPAACELLGRDLDSLIKQPIDECFDVVDTATGEPAVLPVHAVLASGKASALEETCELRRDDGTRIAIADACTPLAGADGVMRGAVLIFRDVSSERAAAAAVKKASEYKDQFLAMLGHELRNPLSAICNATRLLEVLVQHNDAKLQRPVDVLARQSENLTLLVDDLLDVSRVARGKLAIETSRLDPRSVLRNVLDDMRVKAENRSLRLFAEIAGGSDDDPGDGEMTILGDSVRLYQIFGNVVGNAIKFTDEGEVRVSMMREGDEIVLRVSDTGMGMTDEELALVFEPFQQGEQGFHRPQGGLGLGLSVVKGLVVLHDGTVEAHSEGRGQGTTMTLRFPCAPVRARTNQPVSNSEPSLSSSSE